MSESSASPPLGAYPFRLDTATHQRLSAAYSEWATEPNATTPKDAQHAFLTHLHAAGINMLALAAAQGEVDPFVDSRVKRERGDTDIPADELRLAYIARAIEYRIRDTWEAHPPPASNAPERPRRHATHTPASVILGLDIPVG